MSPIPTRNGCKPKKAAPPEANPQRVAPTKLSKLSGVSTFQQTYII